MKTYFDEATDKKLLEASTEEEVRAIIAETPEAEKLADKIDLVMNEISRIKGALDEEVDLDELDNASGGAKRVDVYLSETQGCVATFYLEDQMKMNYCWSNDQCGVSNEYKYHNTKYSNCKKGGRHDWTTGSFERYTLSLPSDCPSGQAEKISVEGNVCRKCGLNVAYGEESEERFNS